MISLFILLCITVFVTVVIGNRGELWLADFYRAAKAPE